MSERTHTHLGDVVTRVLCLVVCVDYRLIYYISIVGSYMQNMLPIRVIQNV